MAPKQTGRYSRNEFVEYPKLELFKGKMKVKRMIHESDHSAVFEVVSDGNHYALKIVSYLHFFFYPTNSNSLLTNLPLTSSNLPIPADTAPQEGGRSKSNSMDSFVLRLGPT